MFQVPAQQFHLVHKVFQLLNWYPLTKSRTYPHYSPLRYLLDGGTQITETQRPVVLVVMCSWDLDPQSLLCCPLGLIMISHPLFPLAETPCITQALSVEGSHFHNPELLHCYQIPGSYLLPSLEHKVRHSSPLWLFKTQCKVLHYHGTMEVETPDVIIVTTFSILMEIVIFQNCRQKHTDHMLANKAVRFLP